MSKIEYLEWKDNQLTLHLEYRNILIDQMTPAMEKLKDQYATQGWDYLVTGRQVAEYAVDEFDLLKVGEGWIAFTVTTPWFMTEEVITEDFIYNVPLDLAVALLRELGRANGCKRLVVGTRAAPDGKHLGLCRMYEKRGFQVSTLELTLEIP